MKLDWNKMGDLIPAVIQDAVTDEFLMLGYMNPEAYELTLRTGEVTFYSRSKNALWKKGETSGNRFFVVDLKNDCDGDALLIRVRPVGPACHRMTTTCFDSEEKYGRSLSFLSALEALLTQRLKQVKDKESSRETARPSYVVGLLREGLDRVIQKLGEEAIETVIAAKNLDRSRLESEAADLLFHLMVLLQFRGSSLSAVVAVLEQRHPGG